MGKIYVNGLEVAGSPTLGDNDISAYGDGTVTGALISTNNKITAVLDDADAAAASAEEARLQVEAAVESSKEAATSSRSAALSATSSSTNAAYANRQATLAAESANAAADSANNAATLASSADQFARSAFSEASYAMNKALAAMDKANSILTSYGTPYPVKRFYVNGISGNDTNPGTTASPFATLDKALAEATKVSNSVYIHITSTSPCSYEIGSNVITLNNLHLQLDGNYITVYWGKNNATDKGKVHAAYGGYTHIDTTGSNNTFYIRCSDAYFESNKFSIYRTSAPSTDADRLVIDGEPGAYLGAFGCDGFFEYCEIRIPIRVGYGTVAFQNCVIAPKSTCTYPGAINVAHSGVVCADGITVKEPSSLGSNLKYLFWCNGSTLNFIKPPQGTYSELIPIYAANSRLDGYWTAVNEHLRANGTGTKMSQCTAVTLLGSYYTTINSTHLPFTPNELTANAVRYNSGKLQRYDMASGSWVNIT